MDNVHVELYIRVTASHHQVITEVISLALFPAPPDFQCFTQKNVFLYKKKKLGRAGNEAVISSIYSPAVPLEMPIK